MVKPKVDDSKLLEMFKKGYNANQIINHHWHEIRLSPDDDVPASAALLGQKKKRFIRDGFLEGEPEDITPEKALDVITKAGIENIRIKRAA